MQSLRMLRGLSRLPAARALLVAESTILQRPAQLIHLQNTAQFTTSRPSFAENSRGFLSPNDPDPLRRTPPANVGIRWSEFLLYDADGALESSPLATLPAMH